MKKYRQTGKNKGRQTGVKNNWQNCRETAARKVETDRQIVAKASR